MDPPTPWVAWAAALWAASLNQNLLHPDTAPVARELEARAVAWLAPYFGMTGGHLVPGSTLATLTALWAARDLAGVTEVVAADTAHLSVAKSAHLLGLRFRAVPTDARGALRADALPLDLARAALVLTAGSTSTGAVDPLALADRAASGAAGTRPAWTHVDAAWAGPLRLCASYADRLAGVEHADSVAVSGHKWLFQPKESALVLFRDAEGAHGALAFGGAYLAAPNVGLLGSHGAAAVPLLATLLAWGRAGLAARVEHCMALADGWAAWVAAEPGLELLARPETGVVVWRPVAGTGGPGAEALHAALPAGAASLTTLGGARWLRNVAANPNADLDALGAAVRRARAPAA
jgi:L-2,4-diaminobutyrate decarboxylase